MPLLLIVLFVVVYIVIGSRHAAQAEVEAQKADARGDERSAGTYRMVGTLAFGGLLLLLILIVISAPVWGNLHP